MACEAAWIWLALSVTIGFMVASYDKWQAKRRHWRVPEKSLVALAWLGAGAGLLLAFVVWRHKVRKPRLLAQIVTGTVLNALAVVWVLNTLQCIQVIGS